MDCRQYQGGIPQIYSDWEAHTAGDVGHNIPHIYPFVDSRQADHHASIIEMDDQLCNQVVSISIYLGSNYSYNNPKLVNKCGL